MCVIIHPVKMRTSISKREILTVLLERGFTSPNDAFVQETERILYDEFHLDETKKCDSTFVTKAASNFGLSVQILWNKYRKLDPILTNNTVRKTIRLLRNFYDILFK